MLQRDLVLLPRILAGPQTTTWALFPRTPVSREGRKFGEGMHPVESTRLMVKIRHQLS